MKKLWLKFLEYCAVQNIKDCDETLSNTGLQGEALRNVLAQKNKSKVELFAIRARINAIDQRTKSSMIPWLFVLAAISFAAFFVSIEYVPAIGHACIYRPGS